MGQVVIMEAGGNDFNSGTLLPGWADAYKGFLYQARTLTLGPATRMRDAIAHL